MGKSTVAGRSQLTVNVGCNTNEGVQQDIGHDLSHDGKENILDVVLMVEWILDTGNAQAECDDAPYYTVNDIASLTSEITHPEKDDMFSLTDELFLWPM